MMRLFILSLITAALSTGCDQKGRHPAELELRRSFKNYIFSVEELHSQGLENYVFFPGVPVGKYKDHVRDLLSGYLTRASSGTVTFDDQGVVLSRFLRMTFHNYEVIEVEQLDERDYRMRLAFAFSYDSLLERADYEEGTRVLIPGEPLGKVYNYVVDGENEIPRYQLTYIEVDVVMRRTNYEGYYQVRTCKPVVSSAIFEETFRG